MTALAYAWRCLKCSERGTGPGSDLAARKHEKATSHSTTTHLDRPKSGWCSAPAGARPKHEACRGGVCPCPCHEESAA